MKGEQETPCPYRCIQATETNESGLPALTICVTNRINIIIKLFMAFAGTTAYTVPFYIGKIIRATLEIKQIECHPSWVSSDRWQVAVVRASAQKENRK